MSAGRAGIRVRIAGSAALLLDCGSLERALDVFAQLDAARERRVLDADDIVPAAETVLVRGGLARDPRAFSARLDDLLTGDGDRSRADDSGETVIPVRYDGDDLDEVARIAGMSADQVIDRHVSADYTVAFTGFAPGFAYLAGGDPALDVPRRSTPRPRIAAGSVGLAGRFSGVYPRQSPGGWQLIGRTQQAMWDLGRDRPALLVPGARVRFAVERDRLEVRELIESREAAPPVSGRASLTIVEPGLGSLVQDRGRPGHAALGVSTAGSADRGALDRANRIVGNAEGAAVIELGIGEFSARAERDAVLAITGAPRTGRILGEGDDCPVISEHAFRLAAGERLVLDEPARGFRTVLALRGGVDAPLLLGSASRDTLAGLGPAPLEAGDTVHAGDLGIGEPTAPRPARGKLPVPGRVTTLRVIPGPRDDWFAREGATGAKRLWNQEWTVTPRSDRVGVRLAGAPLARAEAYASAELPSEGLVTGALQVPPDGQPVLFLADRPLTGGYPVIGVVCEDDLDLAAQLPPGARVRFVPWTTPEHHTGTDESEHPMSESPGSEITEQPSTTAPAAGTPIRTVLIANRGEIAVRIVRAVREAGLRSVAVYADADIDALHVRTADDAYALYGETPGETYLDSSKLLEVARLSGADAVHPGYGFLSESAAFARAVADAGLTWIGPGPDAIELLGDKARARALAAEVGAPLVPGTNEPVRDASEVQAFAEEHGLPIAIKAVHGGGGRGMRVVHEREQIAEAYESAVREAVTAFGQGDCLVERFLERPRHIEAQVLGDHHGRIAVLGTRDCSLQRRNQKLVEEAPAPFIDDDLRDRIHAAAADICGAAGYVGAGTVEFLLGEDDTLTFLEVNTRLQVEHPVTEMTTGIDLVQEQLRIAAGEPMRVPDDIPVFGHAFEFRINAEDPALGYAPTPGVLTRFDPPSGQGVRLDSGFGAGQTIPGSFDSLIAKLVIWGRDRDEALARARRALGEFAVEGVATVLSFDRFVVEDPAFTAAGESGFAVHTRWIEEECTADFTEAASIASAGEPGLTRLPIEIDGRRAVIGLPSALLSRLGVNGGGATSTGESGASGADELADPGAVVAPFAGTLSSWKFEEGATVSEGDTVAILEAMKMEVPVKAPRGGTLCRAATEGESLAAGATLGTVEGS